jgi:purine-binding chemotaxis protein CheW
VPRATEEETRSFVVFRLGSEEYGVDIDRVQGIIRYEEPTPVPRAPEIVQGVINMRGRVIPVVDLSARLRGVRFEQSVHSRIVEADGEAGTLGLAVDGANEVASIPVADIQPAPEGVLTPETASAITGVAERGGRLVIMLDLDETVPRSDYTQVAGEHAAKEGNPDA